MQSTRVSLSYRRRHCERDIVTQDCPGGSGSDKLVSRNLVKGCGKEDVSIDRCPARADSPSAHLETFPACMFVPGIHQGQPSYQRALHIYAFSYTVCTLYSKKLKGQTKSYFILFLELNDHPTRCFYFGLRQILPNSCKFEMSLKI